MMRNTMIVWCLLAPAAGLLPLRLVSQWEPQRCDSAEAVLRGGSHSTAYWNALNGIQGCTDRAAPLIAMAWRTAPSDSASRAKLKDAAIRTVDSRIADALLAEVANEGTVRQVRITAMEALAIYYRSCFGVNIIVTDHGKDGVVAAVLSGHWSGNPSTLGPIPPPAPVPSAILSTLDAVGTSTGDEFVRAAAKKLAATLRRMSPRQGSC